tara:strand:+ start:6143 stop:6370 length:228 start_codon:yes stop_codon:yes gene_type:complete
MSDTVVLIDMTVVCQDGVVREGGSLVVRDGQYVFLDADSVALEGDRVVTELRSSVAPMSPDRLSMITAEYGPLLS